MKMRNARVWALLLSAMLLAAPLTACGTNTDPAAAGNSTASKESSASDETDPADSETDAKDSESSKTDAKKDTKADSKAETKKDGKDSASDQNTESKSDDKTESKAGNDSNNDSKTDSKTGSDSKTDSKTDNKNNGQQNSGGNNNSGSTTAPDDGDPDEDDGDEVKPMKYIKLEGTSAKYSGEGISVSGSTVTISKGGHYEISGEMTNGQIYIQTDKKKVKLFLNNCSITNKAGSAINCQAAKKLTFETLPGTVNYISDGGTHDEDKGAVFSEDTVVLKGEGELNITGVYAHGIQSDDDIQVKGGNINITATKSCLHSNDSIEIFGGKLFCDGGTNGIKTDGFVNIMGGSSIFLSGTREEKGAIYCGEGSLTVTGGTFYAIGNTCTMPDASTTTANVIGIVFSNPQPEESVVNVMSGASTLFAMTSPRKYKYVVYSGPDLLTNGEYSVSYGGTMDSASENYVWRSGNYSGGTDGGSFTADSTVKIFTVS